MNKDINIMLVHGAWADGSCWSKVILLLQARGYLVTAAQIPLTSLSDDIAVLRRLVAGHSGPTVLVGHSYGGAVITGAATSTPQVKALVYITAFGLDEGESLDSLTKQGPLSTGSAAIEPDDKGFLWINRDKFQAAFAGDATDDDAAVMAAVQRPLSVASFTEAEGVPAWKQIPSWYLVCTDDRMIPPVAQEMLAQRMRATVQKVAASHAVFMAHPQAVADIIVAAADPSRPEFERDVMNMNGNTILVTGGGSGIGRKLAEAFHRLGNEVIIAGRREGHLQRTVLANPGMSYVILDVASADSIAAVAKDVLGRFPALNVLLNCSGVMEIDDASQAIDDELLTSTLTTNFMGPIRLTGALIEHLKRQPSATVVMVSSVLGFTPMATTAVYSASKAALHSYTHSLRFKLRHTPVRALELIPPWVQTDLLNSSDEPRAMPLDDFVMQTIELLAGDADEILVDRARFLRDQAGPQEAAFVRTFNEQLEQPVQ